jgi:hypothetical protein
LVWTIPHLSSSVLLESSQFDITMSNIMHPGITRAGHRAKLRMLAREHGAWKQTLAMAHSWDGRGTSGMSNIDAQSRFVQNVGHGYRSMPSLQDRGAYAHRPPVDNSQEQYRIHEPASPYMNMCSPRTPHDSTSFLREVICLPLIPLRVKGLDP